MIINIIITVIIVALIKLSGAASNTDSAVLFYLVFISFSVLDLDREVNIKIETPEDSK